MDAQKVAAQFAAHSWYEEVHSGKPAPKEAVRFARDNWQAFQSVAPAGLGRLLIQIAGNRPKKHQKQNPVLGLAPVQ
jgi:hypothetical protein